jgi:hypothetical protein
MLFTAVTIHVLPVLAGAIPIGQNIQITDAGLNDNYAETPDIAVVGDTIYAVWRDTRDNDPYDISGAIYFAKSTDGGATWSQNGRVTDPSYDDWANDPAIAVQPDGTIWIVWYQLYRTGSNKVNDIRLARSTDGGQTFENGYILVDGYDSNETLWRPDIAADAGHVYVLYRYYNCQDPCGANDPDGYTISLKTIDPITLGVTTTIVSDVLYAGRFTDGILDDGPAIDLTLDGGLLCAAWEDYRDRFALYGACSQDNGQSFGANFAITGADSVHPTIALAPDGALIATYALSTDSYNNIWLRRSTDQGVTWSSPTQVSSVDSFEVIDWDLTIDSNGQLILPWVFGSSSGSTDLFLSTSLDDGQNWSAVQVEDNQGLHPTTSDQEYPSVAVRGSGNDVVAHVVWNDDRNMDNQIWSARFVLDGVPPTIPQNLQASPADTAVSLTWEAAADAAGVQGYRVYRAPSAGGPFTEISVMVVNDTSYMDVELPVGVTYFYQVAAVDGTGNTGGRSNVASAAAQQTTDTSTYGTVAYESGEDIRLHTLANGQETAVSDTSRPRYADNGDNLYYKSDQSIWRLPTGGGSPTLFQTLGDANNDTYLLDFDIAANDQNFGAIVMRSFASVGPVSWCTVTEPHAYNELEQPIFTDEYNFSSEITISPDHRWLTYRYTGYCNEIGYGWTSPGDFCIADLNSQEVNCLQGYDYRDSDFAPDSNWIVFAAPITGQYEIWIAKMENDGALTHYTQLTHGAANTPSREPAWSTDGNWIVFQRDMDPGTGEDWRLHLVRADGASLRSLNIAGENPAWNGGGSVPLPPGLTNHVYLPAIWSAE